MVTSVRRPALAAAVIGLVTSALYVGIIMVEGNNTLSQTAPWAATMLTASALALLGAVTPKQSTARGALLAAFVVFAVLGFLAIFTIGILFIGAAVLLAVCLAQIRTP